MFTGQRRAFAIAGACTAVVTLMGSPAAAQQVTYNGTLSYSTGTYVFTDRTQSAWLGNGLTVVAGRVTLSGSLPIIAQNSGVVSFVAGRPLPTGGEQSAVVGGRGKGDRIGSGSGSQSGSVTDSTVVFRDQFEIQVGDPVMTGMVELHRGLGFVRSVSLQGGAKAPVRSLESGVGTGEWDFGAGASVVLGSGRSLILGDASYWWFGDLPDLELAGSLLYSVGVARSVMDTRGSVLLSVSGATSIMDTVDAPLAVGASFLYTVRQGRTVSTGLSVGLSEASPDFSVWVGWGLGL